MELQSQTQRHVQGALVVIGNKKCSGIDFEDTFVVVVCLETFHMIIALVVALDLEAGSWDVIPALLNALIDKKQ